MVSESDLRIPCEITMKKIINFISYNIQNAGLDGAIVSISGGIDSALTLALVVKAIGPEKVTALTMPERDVTPECDIMDVMQHCEALGVTCNTVDITAILHVIQQTLPLYEPDNKITSGNIRSRLRMIIAYHYANSQRRMVIGTSNRTELLSGFFTKYGDGGVDLMPLADLLKTHIRQLAQYLDIPENIINKPPSPGFYPGQTDEDELGIDYLTLDLIIHSWDKGKTNEEIAKDLNIDIREIERIENKIKMNEHKRRLPLILRLS